MALTYNEDLLTDSQRRRLRENNDANFRHAMNSQAHERFVERRLGFVGNHGGAVSPFERNALSGEADRLGFGPRAVEQRRLQEHEMNMLKQKGDDEVRVAEQKRFGMEDQGVAVGKLKHGYTDYDGKYHEGSDERIARTQGENALSLAEKEWAGKKEIADIGLRQHELEWGEGGGRERVAKIEGSSRVGAAEAQAKAVAEQNAQKNALEEQKRIATAEKEKGRLKLQYDKLEQKDRASVENLANALAKEKGISFEDARDQIMAAREQQNAGPQEGATRTLSSGRKVVYRGGQWQYAD